MLENSFKSQAQPLINQFLEERAQSAHQDHNFCNEENDKVKSVEKRQKMAKHVEISIFSMRRVIMDEIQLTPYNKTIGTCNFGIFNTERSRQEEVNVRKMEPAASKIFILSDKKMSTVEAVTNKQKYRAYARRSEDSPVIV